VGTGSLCKRLPEACSALDVAGQMAGGDMVIRVPDSGRGRSPHELIQSDKRGRAVVVDLDRSGLAFLVQVPRVPIGEPVGSAGATPTRSPSDPESYVRRTRM
jgi:hypothetical protein